MKKVLVTGANGFLGSNLLRELCNNGYTLRAFVRQNADLNLIANLPCEIVYGDIQNKADVFRAVSGCQIIVHAAAITDQWGISFQAYEQVNFVGTKNIADACLKFQVSRLIYVSTANTLAPGTKDTPGTELGCFMLFSSNSGYIQSKYLAQQYVLESIEQKGLPAIIVNPTFMIGPNDEKPSSGRLLLHVLKKKVLLCPPGGKNFVSINDVCKGIIGAIEKGQLGDVYLLAGHNLSYREFFRMVSHMANQSKYIIVMPTFILKLFGAIGTLCEALLHKSIKLNYTTAYLLCLKNYYCGKKSEEKLALKYTPINDVISQAVHWFKEHNYYQ